MNASDRAAAILAVAVTILSAAFIGIAVSDDADASVVEGYYLRLDSAEHDSQSEAATIQVNGQDALQVYWSHSGSVGEWYESITTYLHYKVLDWSLVRNYTLDYYSEAWLDDGGYYDAVNGGSYPDILANATEGVWQTCGFSASYNYKPAYSNIERNIYYIQLTDGNYNHTPASGTTVATMEWNFSFTTGYAYTTSVSYNANDGAGSVSTTSREDFRTSASTENVSVTLSNGRFTKEGYEHVGWNTQANGNGTHYDLGESVPVKIGDDITLYAEWRIQSHTVTLYTTDDSNAWKEVLVQHGQRLVVEDPTAPEGKLFAGWYTDNTRTQSYDYPNVTADDSLYALFVDELEFITSPTASHDVTPIEPDGTFMFSSIGSESAAKVLWEFPDGTTSTDRVTTHWFEPGSYKVKLTVWNSLGEASTTEIGVEVGEPDEDSDVLIWVVAGIAIVVIAIIVARRFV